jgi:hypothetical protein
MDVEDGQTAFNEGRPEVIDLTIEMLQSRFGSLESDPIISAYSIFDHRLWPPAKVYDKEKKKDVTNPRLLEYGNKQFQTLLEHNDECFTAHQKISGMNQWKAMKVKVMTTQELENLTVAQLYAKLTTKFSDKYTDALVLVVFFLLLMVDTAECERIFSLMNRLKTPLRNRLSTSTLRDIMMICRHGPASVAGFDPWRAIAKWHDVSQLPRAMNKFKDEYFKLVTLKQALEEADKVDGIEPRHGRVDLHN